MTGLKRLFKDVSRKGRKESQKTGPTSCNDVIIWVTISGLKGCLETARSEFNRSWLSKKIFIEALIKTM